LAEKAVSTVPGVIALVSLAWADLWLIEQQS
jgi:hypothetical protein